MKRHLILGRKVMTNLDSMLKTRNITLLTKVHLVKAMVFPYRGFFFLFFPAVMYVCERWTIKKAEWQRIDAFELWCWRRLLEITWTARRSNHSILKEISPEYSLEGLMLKMKLIVWPPDMKNWLIGKDYDWEQEKKGMIEDEMAGWHHGLDGCESEWTPGDGDEQGGLACCDSWGRKESDTTERLNWTDSVMWG